MNRKYVAPLNNLGTWVRNLNAKHKEESLLESHNMKADLDKLASDPNKLVTEARNEVARMLRVLLREHRITNEILTNRIREWSLKRTRGDSNSKHANDSGNYVKAIIKPKISFERLITTMEILNPLSWSITIGIKWDTGPEKKIKFNYVSDPLRYEAVTGQKPENYITPIRDDDEEDVTIAK